jgi:hypothetical protein
MHELRLVAVSEDGSYAILEVPGRSGRFSLRIDDRLRTVARGQFSRLAQYQIEVENPLRPKEIQDRIRAGESADEIADAAGIPIERIRRYEGPPLAEREFQAQQAQRATVRSAAGSGPGPRLGEIVPARLGAAGTAVGAEDLSWDSRKLPDGNWLVRLRVSIGGRPETAEWVYDPRRRQVTPEDEMAARLSLPESELPGPGLRPAGQAAANVTPIGARQPPRPVPVRDEPAAAGPRTAAQPDLPPGPGADRGARRAAGGRSKRASVPSWDEIMFGTSRQPD